MIDQITQTFEINNEAITTNKGFYYQYLVILKKWIINFLNDSSDTIFTEVDQDIKEVGENLLFTQVKCYQTSFSLRSQPVRKTIFDFFILYLKYKELPIESNYCFTTNSEIGTSEKLLAKWLADEQLSNPELLELCKTKIKEILLKEIKRKKAQKLNTANSTEKKDEIKTAATKLLALIDAELETFTKSLRWHFENLTPDEAISTIKNEINLLLEHKKFGSRPATLLFPVLISEIFSKSQNIDKNQRRLDNMHISNLLMESDQSLENHINTKFFKLINIELETLRNTVRDVQYTVEMHGCKIENLEEAVNSIHLKKLPKELNLIPDYYSTEIYDWNLFLDAVNSELNKKKLLSIFGTGGMGKTTFAKKYIRNFVDYDHIIWITVENSIRDSFVFDDILLKNLDIDFDKSHNQEQCLKLILGKINNITGKNLVVIDIQDLEDDIESFNLLLTLSNWQKLILTRNHLKKLPAIKLPKIEIQNAKNIFYNHLKKTTVDDDVLTDFIEFVDFNLLLVEIVAKTIENSFELTLEQLLSSLKEQKLDRIEYQVDIDLGNENSPVRIFNYILKKFSLPNLDLQQKVYLEFLSLLPSKDIVIEDLILLNGREFYEGNKITIGNILISLEKKGLVEFSSGRTMINIHKMIKEVILYNARNDNNPFIGNILYISWLTRRIKEGQYNPVLSFKYIRYAQSILDCIKEEFRSSLQQPLLMLENEVLFTLRYYFNSDKNLNKWIDLAQRAEKYDGISEVDVSVIYNNLGLAYSGNDTDQAIRNLKKSVKLLSKHELIYKNQIITILNNISGIYLKSGELVAALENFKIIQNLRKRHNLYNDQQLVSEFKILAESYEMCGDLDKAIFNMMEGIKVHYTLDKEIRNEFYLSDCYHYMAHLYIQKQDLDTAIQYQEKAVSNLEYMNLFDSEHLLNMYKVLQNLYHLKNENEKERETLLKIESFKSRNNLNP
ncbi:NB-ARC domain-containing protein [Sphingobacterium multivorum]|uniref:NB-ARC domain-containing protein n=1 Tax=Sphingobacterium multivorum TaxID=28454 RepID=UPI003DA5E5E7